MERGVESKTVPAEGTEVSGAGDTKALRAEKGQELEPASLWPVRGCSEALGGSSSR